MARPDRALRQMVARLSELPHADYEAVLHSLDERQRARIREMLGEGDGNHTVATLQPAPAQFDASALPEGLSSWLLERLGVLPEVSTALPGALAMTDHAAAALKTCAAELDPAPPAPDDQSLFGRLRRRLGFRPTRRMVGA